MNQFCAAPRLTAALGSAWAWVLDQSDQPVLKGQCCDRWRPAQVRRELEAALESSALRGCTLVDWRWDQRRGWADGWLWQVGVLQRFRWWRDSGRLRLQQQLQCISSGSLRSLT